MQRHGYAPVVCFLCLPFLGGFQCLFKEEGVTTPQGSGPP